MARVTVRTRVHRFDATGEISARADKLAGEEPLEVRLDGEDFTVAMRTPGHDVELVHGFLLAEAVITSRADIVEIDFASGIDPDGSRNYNVARVRLAPGVHDPHRAHRRQVYTSSACGICGTASIEAVQKESAYPVHPVRLGDLGKSGQFGQSGQSGQAGHSGGELITPADLLRLPDRLRAEQTLFSATGGVHAAALFRTTGDAAPELLVVREDVGRHNAVDKVIGWAVAADLLPLADIILQVSGRASFELVQKAAMAGIPLLSAVSAPSALAVDLGRESGLTVVGFNRGTTCNVYTHRERVAGWDSPR